MSQVIDAPVRISAKPSRFVEDAPRSNLPVAGRPKARAPTLATALSDSLEERRIFILAPFAMIAGLIASLETASYPEPLMLGAGAAVIALVLVLGRGSIRVLRVACLAAAFWTGFSLFSVHGALFGTPMLTRPAYGAFEARVDEILSKADGEQRVVVSHITPLEGAKPVDIRRARVFVRKGPDLEPGDVISAPFRFYQVPGPAVPGAFDAQFHSYFDGIGAYGTTNASPVIVNQGSDALPERIIENVRRGIAARIDGVLAEPAAGIARAVINGDQSAVTDEAREVMSTAGLAHVLSISGLHLTLVAGGVYFVLRLLLAAAGWMRSVKAIAAIGGMTSAVLYYSISGGNVAALRSTIMILLVFGAIVAGRRALTMRNVAIAGLIVILSDPASVFRPSFQLSFSAVIALVGAYEVHIGGGRHNEGRGRRLLNYFLGIAATSFVAGAATLLFSVYHFQQTSPLGVVGNLVSLPLVGFIMMPAALLGVLAMPLGLEWLPITVMGWSVDRMLDCAALVATYSRHISASPLLTPLALVIGLAGLAWFAFFKTRWRLLGPALVAITVPLFAIDRPPDVLIADTTQALAFRGPDGLALAAGKPGSFAVQIWEDTYSEPIEKATSGVACDSLGCIAEAAGGYRIAVVRDAAAFGEDCAAVDLVVTRLYAPAYCRSEATVIDAGDLRRGGVHWLKWLGGGFEFRPAIVDLNRPWRVVPR
ncbi:ComEC/Rec2 family competence protein [Paradevosia shaoguanensis]|uniref:Competence protein ComEC family protein n=1 Tax=Paradevosia shaoguanensis TaxID=1335043 RepID=A0AA41UB90_9HYPH|nr:ComEC/Rec2 family competence protein [Paradevosia shaoguanensis]MCF1742369.1 competence protein ComEC family protein [Paradevosia shaoguanensis]MCI0126852.1 competence protein ComEC family protein [Paradevosia shaoguanensis]